MVPRFASSVLQCYPFFDLFEVIFSFFDFLGPSVTFSSMSLFFDSIPPSAIFFDLPQLSSIFRDIFSEIFPHSLIEQTNQDHVNDIKRVKGKRRD
jgi:hypothetical protein